MQRVVSRMAAGALLLAGLIAPFGCSDSKMAEISGSVSVDGAPVAEGAITFIPANGQGPTAGCPIKDGKYHCPSVPIGLMKVQISAPIVVGKKKLYDAPNSPEGLITRESLPARYNEETTLGFEVQRGTNTKDWELTKTKK